jgi:hypothetical protein
MTVKVLKYLGKSYPSEALKTEKEIMKIAESV